MAYRSTIFRTVANQLPPTSWAVIACAMLAIGFALAATL
jgi:hypothetical protein